MTISEIIELVEGKVVCGESYIDQEVKTAFAADLMSDVLTVDTDGMMLITGLTNIQTISPSEMSDVKTILFVRNKKANQAMIELAKENLMFLIECSKSMYATSGLLYNSGLSAVY
jgi:predicted transcriptional regulator